MQQFNPPKTGRSRLIAIATSCGAFALSITSVQGAWSLLDNFDSYSTGATTGATGGAWTSVSDGTANSNIVTTDKGNSLEALGGTAWRGAERDLTGTGATIATGETKTYFWQVMVDYTADDNGTDWNYDFMMGLSPGVSEIDATDAWQDFNVMPYVNNDAPTPFINADAPVTPYWAAMDPGVWHNVWVVVRNDASDPSYDVHYSTGNDAPTEVIQDANWRVERTGMEVGQDLNAMGFMAAGQPNTQHYIDNIHWDSGENLTVVPEPSIALLGGLGVLGLCRRRRH